MILLIVCVNLSNLLLARAAARSKEFALRSALGAGRGRLVRQLLTESLVLAGCGRAAGAWAGVCDDVLSGAPGIDCAAAVEQRAGGWTSLLAGRWDHAGCGGCCLGLLPGLKMSGSNLQEALKDTGHGHGRRAGSHERLRSVLVISEVALACVLLVGAGLLLRSFLHVLDVDLGFRAEPSVRLRWLQDWTITTAVAFAANRGTRCCLMRRIRRVKAIPGVEAAGISDNLPLERNRSWGGPRCQGRDVSEGRGSGRVCVHHFAGISEERWGCASARARL